MDKIRQLLLGQPCGDSVFFNQRFNGFSFI